ncbi:hypothetical protein BFW87_04080 [Pseudomonas fluorescens]|uniref:Uncharacterized protein n=1 Tax=Pseudomonas fluorescens TaxID=294 RepID=A0A1T2Z609_PSEFL|nr:hypothetical protein [Pseudomonas fluorescens]OPA99409.1 hypothetical protein BFW87_04080 [Pseudomonas fluorescens]
MDSLISFALTTAASAGVSAALVLALGWLLRTWIGERLKASLKHEYSERLERLKTDLKKQSDADLASAKAEIDSQAEKLKVAAVSFSEVQKATLPKKIEAVDALWEAVRAARAHVPGIVYMCDVLTDEELRTIRTSQQFKDFRQLLAAIDPVKLTPLIFGDADKTRPHVGEYIWALHSTYHGILVRCVFTLAGKEDARWYRDEVTQRLVRSAFGDAALQQFKTLPDRHFDWLRLEFERELFTSFDKLLTGKAFSEAAMRQAQEMEKALAASTPADL